MADYGVESTLLPPPSPRGYSEPAPPPPSDKPNARPAPPDLATIGATGTPIISGFVEDLQEYNSQMRGRPALQIYEQMRRNDADVAAVLSACKLPIRAAVEDFQVEPAEGAEAGLAKEIAKFVEDNLFGGLESTDSFGNHQTQRFESVIENALLCLDFGCSGSEDLWAIDQDKIRLRRIAPRLPLTFYRFWTMEDGETLEAIEQWGYRSNQFIWAKVPASKFTLFCLNREGANFYGRSILRQAYRHWYQKTQLYAIDGISCERNAMGIPVITLPPSASEEDRKTGLDWVTNLATHENTGLVLPNGAVFELKGIAGRIRDPLPSIQHQSEMICRSALAMFMTLGTTQSGSRALGNAMLDFFQLSEEATAKFLCDTISETTIRRLVDFNFPRSGGKPIPYPRLVPPSIAVLNPVDVMAAIKEVASFQTDLIQPDDELEEWTRKKFGMPPKGKEARVRYSPVMQRIEGQETGNPEETEDPSNPRGQAPRAEAQAAPALPLAPGTQLPQKKTPQARPAGTPQPPKGGRAALTAAPGRAGATAAGNPATRGGRPLSRPLHPHELRHDFDGHAEQQDAAQAIVSGLLRQSKGARIREAARRAAAIGEVTKLGSIQLPFDKNLAKRIAAALEPAQGYGHQAVYDERARALKGVKKLAEGDNSDDSDSAKAAVSSAAQDQPNLIAEAIITKINADAARNAAVAAVDASAQGIDPEDLEQWIIDRLTEGSDASLERYALEGARSAVAGGRWDAFKTLADQISAYVRTEAMDQNTCPPCLAADGMKWNSLDEVSWSPGDDCDGGDACRGQLLPIFKDEGTVTLQ